MKRQLLLTFLFTIATAAYAADPPAKRAGGLFGFGAPKSEQISAGLFPSDNPTPAASPSKPGGEAIFRAGQPQRVEPVSYVIENGRKVEKPVNNSTAPQSENVTSSASGIELASSDEKKKGGLFGFGKRGDAIEENEVVTPVPMPVAVPSAKPVPVLAAPVVSADTPSFEGFKKEKEEKSGWGPFRSRKKSDTPEMAEIPAAAAPAPVVASPVAAPAASPVAEKTAAEKTVEKAGAASPVSEKTKPAATTAATTTFEVPRNESKKDEVKQEEKSSRDGGGLLSPIANLRPPRKEIDLSAAETIIQNGEIVAGSDTSFDAAPMTTGTGPRQAPQVINGVKTYSSWDDVNARSSSAADRIIDKIR